MKRRFRQLLNLYLDGAIDQRGLADLKHLLEASVENQKEFQRQLRLQQAMKQVQRTWAPPEASSQREVIWRNPLGMVAMAAIAVFGCFFWLQSLQFTASFDGVQSLSSIERGTYAINPTHFTHSKVFHDDAALDEVAILRAQHLGFSQSLGQGRHTMRSEPFLSNEWMLHPDERLQKVSVRALPRTWNFHSSMHADALRLDQVSKVQPFVQPASFRIP